MLANGHIDSIGVQHRQCAGMERISEGGENPIVEPVPQCQYSIVTDGACES